ncbi:hypothetical protein EDB84DRAFT_1470875 [Lactarius hengduanensis]|nr:hypothetical protein EDB84DRAFT_1470875 [Lactarius hengduanensis]
MNPDDDVVNQQSGSSANPQPSPGSPSASSSRHKIGDVAAGPTVLPFSLSLTLQNTGSVARDHLASERTFLAYVRTSLSFASAGVALVQLFRVSVSTSANGSLNNRVSAAQYARPLGATLIGLGIAVLGLGTQRYFAVQRALPQGFFPAARLSVFVQAVSLTALIGVVFGILIAVH